MTPEIKKHIQNHDTHNTFGFLRLKGFFILDYDCIMTNDSQIVNVLSHYLLVEFEDGGKIKYRTVMFWHALVKDGYLKIIVYDINKQVIITRLHNIDKTNSICNWVLLDKNIFKDDRLESDF
ncbi:hypothetical protein SAMN05444285_106108 [Draconibacterium orientale]|uniref:Uncharacterized protein n=1 Tax=Draconibacterium orientale TaxID=1168034 RepID=X5DJW1_9BACT|nr:hypothetical protein [Draconibacterium orientale]AHW61439.1 hypothetical protein FH5T_01230 [Draconibacterium orientale]SET12994.1 hypothetical protein SAMN05444285_106108 [Draconibacterium orientale]